MKKKMLWISGLSLAGLLASAVVYHFTRSSILLSLAITSGLAALFDCLFVIMQRYNRPRLMRLMRRSYTKPQVN